MAAAPGRGAIRATTGRTLLLAAVVLAAGCTPAAEGTPEAGRRDSLAALAPALLDLVRAAPMARAWRDGRAGASLHRLGDGDRDRRLRRTATAVREGWCGRGTRDVALADGDTARETVYFYPPSPGDSAGLPEATDDADAWTRGCRLRAAELRLDADSATGPPLGTEAMEALEARLGPPSGGLEREIPRGRWLEPGAFWRWSGGKVAAGYDGVTDAVIVSVAHASAAAGPDPWRERSQRRARRIGELRDSARSRGLGTALPLDTAEQVLAALRRADGASDSAGGLALDSAYVSTLAAWKTAADDLPPGDRAAAYLLGDRLVTSTYRTVSRRVTSSRPGAADSSLIRRLTPLGLDFRYSPLGAAHSYVHSWLWKAREIAPEGTAVADDAFVALLRRGMDTSGTCAEGAAQFAAVIREGGRFLRERGSVAERKVLAEVHRMVGDAYADVVTVAADATHASMYVGEDDYPVPPDRARKKALEHYRAVLERTDDEAETRAIWEDAWRLAAGLPLERTRFVCVYD